MNKLDKNKQIERPKVEPLGDIRIAEARGNSSLPLILFHYRLPGADEKGYIRDHHKNQIQYRRC
jgi:hypothetical protein